MMVALLWLVHHGELGLDELEPASCDRSTERKFVEITGKTSLEISFSLLHHSMGQILELELLVIECW
jgi:hypothetical protein